MYCVVLFQARLPCLCGYDAGRIGLGFRILANNGGILGSTVGVTVVARESLRAPNHDQPPC